MGTKEEPGARPFAARRPAAEVGVVGVFPRASRPRITPRSPSDPPQLVLLEVGGCVLAGLAAAPSPRVPPHPPARALQGLGLRRGHQLAAPPDGPGALGGLRSDPRKAPAPQALAKLWFGPQTGL